MFVARVFLVVLFCTHANAFLDTLAKNAESMAKAAAISDALTDVIFEIDPMTETTQEVRKFSERQYRLNSEIQELYYVSGEVKDFLKGPDLSGRGIENALRSSASYIRTSKNLIGAMAALGPDGATAYSSMQSSVALNDIRSQQAIAMAEQRSEKQNKIKNEVNKEKQWAAFIKKSRQRRSNL